MYTSEWYLWETTRPKWVNEWIAGRLMPSLSRGIAFHHISVCPFNVRYWGQKSLSHVPHWSQYCKSKLLKAPNKMQKGAERTNPATCFLLLLSRKFPSGGTLAHKKIDGQGILIPCTICTHIQSDQQGMSSSCVSFVYWIELHAPLVHGAPFSGHRLCSTISYTMQQNALCSRTFVSLTSPHSQVVAYWFLKSLNVPNHHLFVCESITMLHATEWTSWQRSMSGKGTICWNKGPSRPTPLKN